ncbi:MAG: FlgB family protein [Rubellimicrobium sp.]|nr:FlgB family protein [Rubellimicrobium sp.]
MFDSLDVFRLSGAMAAHAARQQALVATNVAHADSPGYRAQRLDDFSTMLRSGTAPALRSTRPGHMAPEGGITGARAHDADGQAAPNGNTVSLENEMFAAADAAREHSRALAIYRHGLTVLRLSLGR